jgi:DNA-directed RNA polymerase specialized sigma24 family protein
MTGISSDAAVWTRTLRTMALILTGDCERADDLAERTIMRALAGPKERPPESTLNVWMLSILHKCHWDEPSEDRLANKASDAPYACGHDESGDFRAAFWRLVESEREILILVEAIGLSRKEVAQVYSSSLDAVSLRYARARRELVRTLPFSREETPYSKEPYDRSSDPTTESHVPLILDFRGLADRLAAVSKHLPSPARAAPDLGA